MRGLMAAATLLTRVPLGPAQWDRSDLARSVAWMPLVGAGLGVVVAAAYALASIFLPAIVSAGIATTVAVILTGALHEDGLADTVDGFGGASHREETLQIMRDPSHGTYGILALALSLVLRVTALSALPTSAAWLVLPAVHSMSRAGAAGMMGAMPPASSDGLGAAHIVSRPARPAIVAVVSALAIGALLVGWWVVMFATLTAAAAVLFGTLAMRRISGFTGDVLGAAQQLGEVAMLVLVAGLAGADLIQGAWWS